MDEVAMDKLAMDEVAIDKDGFSLLLDKAAPYLLLDESGMDEGTSSLLSAKVALTPDDEEMDEVGLDDE